MLQQTRVEAVKPYFERFIAALPDIESAATCDEDKLLKLWEGLGYYNRIRNIQKAAIRVTEEYQGKLPADYQLLKELPGIGNYTAGAVASIAYGIPVPAVDGNVLRVYSRIMQDYDDIMKQSVRTRVERELQDIMPKDSPGEFNQALMELGAMVCVPNGMAKCEICPVSHLCKAYKNHTVMELPVKKKPKERRIEEKTVLVILDGERVAIRKRPSKGLLAGLYELPNLDGRYEEKDILEWMKQYELFPLRIRSLEKSKHIFSHVEWRMTGYEVKVAQLDKNKEKDMLFVDIDDAEEKYPVPAAFQAYASHINMKLGQDKYEKTGRIKA
jgi:A/G-specific adenine glycosylase